jgi:hypothetical protein
VGWGWSVERKREWGDENCVRRGWTAFSSYFLLFLAGATSRLAGEKKREDLLAKHAVSAVATFYALSPAAGSVDLPIGTGCEEKLRPAYGEG